MAAFVTIEAPIDGSELIWLPGDPQNLTGQVGGIPLLEFGVRVVVTSAGVDTEIYYNPDDGLFDIGLHLVSAYQIGSFSLTVSLWRAGAVVASATVAYTVLDPAAIPAPALVDSVDARLGRHLKNRIRLTGKFYEGATAIFGDAAEAGTLVTIDETRLDVITPLCSVEGPTFVLVTPAAGAATTRFPLRVYGTGYWILRALLPPKRYTTDTTNPFNVVLAGIGKQLDRIEFARLALREREIFPLESDALLFRFEEIYGIPTNLADSLELRRSRVDAARRAAPRLSLPYLDAIVAAVLDATITENEGYADYGDLIWQYQAYEPTQNYLADTVRAALLRSLVGSGPGWTRPAVGARGFIVGCSKCGRDFLS